VAKLKDEFHRVPVRHQAWCKMCRRAYDSDHWRRTRLESVRQHKKRRDGLREWYRELKEGEPCTDCRGVFHHAAMQWDHLPGLAKKRKVSNMVRRGLHRGTILEEIAKCELVCANCHAVQTFDRSRNGV
jgi:hypothetical protein